MLLSQVTCAMQTAQAGGHGLRYAGARAALWLLNDFAAHLEAFLFSDAISREVRARIRDDGGQLRQRQASDPMLRSTQDVVIKHPFSIAAHLPQSQPPSGTLRPADRVR